MYAFCDSYFKQPKVCFCNRSSLKKMRPFSLHAAINYCGFRWRVFFFLFAIIILKFCNVWLILNNHLEIVPCEWTAMFQFHVNSRKYWSFVWLHVAIRKSKWTHNNAFTKRWWKAEYLQIRKLFKNWFVKGWKSSMLRVW